MGSGGSSGQQPGPRTSRPAHLEASPRRWEGRAAAEAKGRASSRRGKLQFAQGTSCRRWDDSCSLRGTAEQEERVGQRVRRRGRQAGGAAPRRRPRAEPPCGPLAVAAELASTREHPADGIRGLGAGTWPDRDSGCRAESSRRGLRRLAGEQCVRFLAGRGGQSATCKQTLAPPPSPTCRRRPYAQALLTPADAFLRPTAAPCIRPTFRAAAAWWICWP